MPAVYSRNLRVSLSFLVLRYYQIRDLSRIRWCLPFSIAQIMQLRYTLVVVTTVIIFFLTISFKDIIILERVQNCSNLF